MLKGLLIGLGLWLCGHGAAAAQQAFDAARSFDRAYAQRNAPAVNPAALMFEALDYERQDRGGPFGVRDVGDLRDPACGCLYDKRQMLADPSKCPALAGVVDESQVRFGALRVVDADSVVQSLACHRTGLPRCVGADGIRYGGVRCCVAHDADVRMMLRDPLLFVPAPEALARRLEGYVVGQAAPGSPQVCGWAVDASARVFSVPDELQGWVARAWLYAMRRYGARAPAAPDALQALSDAYPPDRREMAIYVFLRHRLGSRHEELDRRLPGFEPSPGFSARGIRK